MLRSTHAAPDERTKPLPGDELLPEVIGSFTHAVTIRRPRKDVWPWLAQMGSGRAGWYSWDIVDNGRKKSARRVLPELQRLFLGEIMPWLPGATEGFTLLKFEPERYLVLGALPPREELPLMTWAFVLEEPRPGVTRLVVRARGREGYQPPFHLPRWTVTTLVPWGHGFMQRKQLRGIARRAESLGAVH